MLWVWVCVKMMRDWPARRDRWPLIGQLMTWLKTSLAMPIVHVHMHAYSESCKKNAVLWDLLTLIKLLFVLHWSLICWPLWRVGRVGSSHVMVRTHTHTLIIIINFIVFLLQKCFMTHVLSVILFVFESYLWRLLGPVLGFDQETLLFFFTALLMKILFTGKVFIYCRNWRFNDRRVTVIMTSGMSKHLWLLDIEQGMSSPEAILWVTVNVLHTCFLCLADEEWLMKIWFTFDGNKIGDYVYTPYWNISMTIQWVE